MSLDQADCARLAVNVERVRERIDQALLRCGRKRDEVRLLPVTKSVPIPVCRALLHLGLRAQGENRPERLPRLALEMTPPDRPEWHLIGHIQSRKIRSALPWTHCVHSVHSTGLLQNLATESRHLGRVLPVLLQVNVTGEVSKQGFVPGGLGAALTHAADFPSLRVEGLMTMAPLDADEPMQRRTFAALRELRDQHATQGTPLRELSMGMSSDFESAVLEGATTVRVGSALYEGLQCL